MTTGQANEYAIERFNSHCARFDAIAAAIESGSVSFAAELQQYEHLDNPFQQIDLTTYSAERAGGAPK